MVVGESKLPGVDKIKNKRGSVNNKRRLDVFAKKGGQGGADWGGVDAEKLQTIVVQITELGGAVTFGTSRNKGAHSLTLMLDDHRETLWFNGDADLGQELDDTAAMLATLS